MSSLLNQLAATGSVLSYNRTIYPANYIIPINPQANMGDKKSIHSNGTPSDSYSLNGTNAAGAQTIFNAYNDGLNNFPPPPSGPGFTVPDLDGYVPNWNYTANTPEGVSIVRG